MEIPTVIYDCYPLEKNKRFPDRDTVFHIEIIELEKVEEKREIFYQLRKALPNSDLIVIFKSDVYWDCYKIEGEK